MAATARGRVSPQGRGRYGARRRGSRRPPLLLLVPSLAAAGVALLPLWYLASRALEEGWGYVVAEVAQARTLTLVRRSLVLAATVTGLCLVIGTSAAWLVVRTDVPWRRVWHVLLTLPLAVPSYVSAYLWLSWRRSLAGFSGAVLVLTLASYPYVYLPVTAALRRLDPAQEEVARALGHGSVRVFLRVTLRQVLPAVSAGSLLVALYVLSDFGAVGTMRYEVFTWTIYAAYQAGFSFTRAAILAVVLVALAAVLVTAEARTRGARSHARLGSGSPRPQPAIRLGLARYGAFGLCAAVVASAVGFPAGSLAFWLRRGLARGVDWNELFDAARATLYVAALAAFVTMVLAVPVGVLAARHRTAAVRVIERSTYVAHAMPGVVIGMAVVYAGVVLLFPWYQKLPLLVLAYAVLFLPLGVGVVRASVEQTPPILEDVGRSLGRTHGAVLARITLPLAAPGVLAGAALVALTCMKELPATLMLHPTGMDTLATELWQYTAISAYADAAPYALALVSFGALPALALSMSLRRERVQQ